MRKASLCQKRGSKPKRHLSDRHTLFRRDQSDASLFTHNMIAEFYLSPSSSLSLYDGLMFHTPLGAPSSYMVSIYTIIDL